MVTTGTPGKGRKLPCSALRLTHQERAWAAYFLKGETLSGRTGPEIQFAMKKKNQERESDSWELVEAAEASRSGSCRGVKGSERHAWAGGGQGRDPGPVSTAGRAVGRDLGRRGLRGEFSDV